MSIGETIKIKFYKSDRQDPEEFMKEFYTILEKSRIPGHFDYSQPQTYYALFPEIEQMNYVTIGGETHRNLAISDTAN